MESSSPNSLLFYSRFNPFPQTPLTQPFFMNEPQIVNKVIFIHVGRLFVKKSEGKRGILRENRKKNVINLALTRSRPSLCLNYWRKSANCFKPVHRNNNFKQMCDKKKLI